jgi:hypothetical protein
MWPTVPVVCPGGFDFTGVEALRFGELEASDAGDVEGHPAVAVRRVRGLPHHGLRSRQISSPAIKYSKTMKPTLLQFGPSTIRRTVPPLISLV